MSQRPAAASRGGLGPFIVIALLGSALFIAVSAGLNPWDSFLVNPLINALILLDFAVLGQFGLAILLFTLLIRLATLPLTIRQLHSTRAMQALVPKQEEIKKKYKDPRRRQEELMKLYREEGVNPLGCIWPLAIQMLVFVALYRSLVFMVGGSPESLLGLSQRIYPLPILASQIPLEQNFLWLNLGQPDATFILPVLVGISTYVQQRLMQTPAATPQQQQQQQMMNWMMPLVMVWITMALPSGVGVYWVASNIVGVFTSYLVYGPERFRWRQVLLPGAPAQPARPPRAPEKESGKQEEAEPALTAPSTPRARDRHGKRRGKRKNRR